MSRKKHETAIEAGTDVFDQVIADRRAAEAAAVVGQVAAATELPPGQPATNGHARRRSRKNTRRRPTRSPSRTGRGLATASIFSRTRPKARG